MTRVSVPLLPGQGSVLWLLQPLSAAGDAKRYVTLRGTDEV